MNHRSIDMKQEAQLPFAVTFLVMLDCGLLLCSFIPVILAVKFKTESPLVLLNRLIETGPFIVLNIIGLFGIARMKRWGADLQLALSAYVIFSSIQDQNILLHVITLAIIHLAILIRYRTQMQPYWLSKIVSI